MVLQYFSIVSNCGFALFGSQRSLAQEVLQQLLFLTGCHFSFCNVGTFGNSERVYWILIQDHIMITVVGRMRSPGKVRKGSQKVLIFAPRT